MNVSGWRSIGSEIKMFEGMGMFQWGSSERHEEQVVQTAHDGSAPKF